jgi:transposase-like protein
MGLFDTVNFTCPHCGKTTGVQSKAGPCDLITYDERDVPLAIAAALGDERETCEHCDRDFVLRSSVPDTVVMRAVKPAVVLSDGDIDIPF